MRHFAINFLLWLCVLQQSSALRSPTVKLLNGHEMPVVGFGTHFRTPTEEFDAVMSALEMGYRHFDTAFAYKNEKNLGAVLKEWIARGGNRDELFITTKLSPAAMRPSDVEAALKESLENLNLDYIDMYLIHLPVGFKREKNFDISFWDNGTVHLDYDTDHISVWRKMEEQVRAGRVKSIGLSNFNESQVLRVWNEAEIKPVNLQVEGNVYLQQKDLRALCKKLGMTITAYSPLGSGDIKHVRRRKRSTSPLGNPVVQRIAQEHEVPVGQVLLRYLLDLGFVIIPKSGKPKRMMENFDLFGFELTEENRRDLEGLDQNGRIRKFDFQAQFPGINNHPEYPFTHSIPKNQ